MDIAIKEVMPSLRVYNKYNRERLKDNFNSVLLYLYNNKKIKWHCVASNCMGESAYKHKDSSWLIHSGFKVTIVNDECIDFDRMRSIAETLLSDGDYLLDLMKNGYDTLVIYGAKSKKELKYGIKCYLNNA